MATYTEGDEGRYRAKLAELVEGLKDINVSLEDCEVEVKVADCLKDGDKLRSELTRRNELLRKKQDAERALDRAHAEFEYSVYERKAATSSLRPKRHWWQF